jgi:hypothetical protein
MFAGRPHPRAFEALSADSSQVKIIPTLTALKKGLMAVSGPRLPS